MLNIHFILLVLSKNELAKYDEKYKRHDLIDQRIINKHSQYINNNFNIDPDEANKCLRSI